MLYQIAHILQHYCPFLWNGIEKINDYLFLCRYRTGMARLNDLQLGYTRLATEQDAPALVQFFQSQPQDAFTYFQPHPFDQKSLTQLLQRQSMIIWLTFSEENQLIGYAFLRCFFIGKGFRGYIVDAQHRGQGIGQQLGQALNETQKALQIPTFKSIAPTNLASLKLAQRVCQLVPVETTNNGDTCFQCLISVSD